METLEILKRLVEIPSPSGKEDELIEFLVDTFEEMGYEPTILEDEVKDVVVNPKAKIWIATHLDTVPVKRGFEFDGVYAYGTGVCDTKGSITAIILALKEIEDLRIGIALFSDEEEGGRGSKIFVERFEPGVAVVMEPTSLRIANVHYGSLEVEMEFRGESAHGSTPEFGKNAIEMAIRTVLDLKNSLGKGIKMLVQKIEGGWDEYAVPDLCRVRLDFVFPPEIGSEDLVAMISRFGKFEVIERSEGFVSGRSAEILADAIRMAGMKVEYCAMPSWTDAVNLRAAGWDVVVFGPGELHYCHTPKERIDPKEIEMAKDVLTALNDLARRLE